MKILHTSDWHLGQTLYGRKRYEEFRAFLDWLIQTMEHESVDVLLVSGDIFDSGLPSNQTQTLYYNFLRKAAQGPCRHIVLTAGNHDSPTFLDAPRGLLKAMDVHVLGHARTPDEEVLLLADDDGNPELLVCAVPFLRERDLSPAADFSPEARDLRLVEGLREHYRLCAKKAEQLRNDTAADLPIIAMGHLFAAGGAVEGDDGVRDLHVGSLGQITADIFPHTFDYVALGHLHMTQIVNGEERIRYSGAPLPMGFGEAGKQKKVFLLKCDGRDISVRGLDVPYFQKLERICGDLPAIEARLAELTGLDESVWVEVQYTGSAIVNGLREHLEKHASPKTEILRIRIIHGLEASLSAACEEESLDDLSVYDVFDRRLDDAERFSGLTAEQRIELRSTYNEAVNEYFLSREENGGDAPCES